MSQELLLSVIIPTFRRPDALDRCLISLIAGAELIQPDRLEIVVSDDDPSGSARELVRQYPDFVTWTQGPCRGPAANRNAGARRTKGDLLIFLDDDCIPHKDLLAAYAEAAQNNPQADIVEGKIVADRQMRYAYEVCPTNETGGYLWSANMAVRRGCFESLGGFDEDYPFAAMEDMDFHYRCQKASKVIVFCPRACVCHPIEVRTGVSRLSKGRYSLLLYAEKHPEQIDRLRGKCDVVSMLRQIKHRIVNRKLVQPPASYWALVEDLWSTFLFFRILARPSSITRKRQQLGSVLLGNGEGAK